MGLLVDCPDHIEFIPMSVLDGAHTCGVCDRLLLLILLWGWLFAPRFYERLVVSCWFEHSDIWSGDILGHVYC